jgi:hypothetical protein
VHQYWHDLESFFWVAIHAIFRQLEGLTVKRQRVENMESRVQVLDDVFPFYKGEDGLGLVIKSKTTFLGARVEIEDCPHLSDAITRTSKEFGRLHTAFHNIDSIIDGIDTQLRRAQRKPISSIDPVGHYQAEGLEHLVETLNLLSSELTNMKESGVPLDSLPQEIEEFNNSMLTLKFPSYDVLSERWRSALLDPPSPCITYIPPKEISINDLLIGKTLALPQERSLDGSGDSPCKGRDNKRKLSQSNVSRFEKK